MKISARICAVIVNKYICAVSHPEHTFEITLVVSTAPYLATV